jgi:TPR repeat protein
MNCKKCKSVAYCSTDCQRQDWKTHKPMCQRKEFAGAPCDLCGSTEDVAYGHVCLECGCHLCRRVCAEQHVTRDLSSGEVVSFAPCPLCNKRRDFHRASDCKKLEKLIKESPRDPRLANWHATLGARITWFNKSNKRKEEHKAKEHFLRAGELGFGEGYCRFAEICRKKRNFEEARRYYKMAAEKFHVIAIYNLANEAFHGGFAGDQEDHRREPDLEGAFHFYREGARLGHAGCCHVLGQCYREGMGVEEVNLVKGFKWTKVAAEKGDADGMVDCADCYLWGSGVEQSDEQALYWYEKHLELEDNEKARDHVQLLLGRGRRTPENLAKVFKWAKVVAENGDADNMVKCADCYLFGTGVEHSDEQALYWYEKSLEIKDAENVRHNVQVLRGRCRSNTGSS